MKTLLLFLVVFGLIDLYIYKGLSTILAESSQQTKIWTNIIYWGISALCIGLVVYGVLNRGNFRGSNTLSIIIGIFLTFFVPKLIFLAFHAMDDIMNLLSFGYSKVAQTDFSRRNFITQMGMVAGSLMFGGMVYGIVWGKFNFRVLREMIASPKLPQAFDGLKIVQISDAHLGSFGGDLQPVQRAVQMINELQPDLVLFTGDMVNVHANEAEPWIDVFSSINAKYGKFSVFGNHDYADYGNYTPAERAASVDRLKEIHGLMGFKLLEDEHHTLQKDGQAISLLGVHNWGQGFHQVGDLQKAMKGVPDDHFKILLSHDPTHFEKQVKGHTNIDLTLSGHTHGMQMGIEIPALKIKWSPVRLRYARWAGLYQENQQRIYINRGFGVLAFPGRVGMAPEITLLTLRSLA